PEFCGIQAESMPAKMILDPFGCGIAFLGREQARQNCITLGSAFSRAKGSRSEGRQGRRVSRSVTRAAPSVFGEVISGRSELPETEPRARQKPVWPRKAIEPVPAEPGTPLL